MRLEVAVGKLLAGGGHVAEVSVVFRTAHIAQDLEDICRRLSPEGDEVFVRLQADVVVPVPHAVYGSIRAPGHCDLSGQFYRGRGPPKCIRHQSRAQPQHRTVLSRTRLTIHWYGTRSLRC